jgi:signal transduction histidine kinase
MVVGAARSVVERYYQALNERDWDGWTAVLAPDVAIAVEAGVIRGREEARTYGQGIVRSFPGVEVEVRRHVAEEAGTVVVEARLVRRADAEADWALNGSLLEIFEVDDGLIAAIRSTYVPDPADRDGAVLLPSRAQAARLLAEQHALRRVAALAAAGASQTEVFDAVVRETRTVLGEGFTALLRYDDDDGHATIVAVCDAPPSYYPGLRVGGEGGGGPSAVFRTGRTMRFDDYPSSEGPDAARAQASGLRSGVAAPIAVDGRLWGMLGVLSATGPLPPETEERMEQFAELVASAIANADSRAALQASRARIAETADATRRRIQRQLHDGAQQELVATVYALTQAREALGDAPAAALVDEALDHARRAIDEVGRLARDVLPAALAHGGLTAAIRPLADQLGLDVTLTTPSARLPRALEITAYFVVAEALENVARHGGVTAADVAIRADDRALRIEVRDDGSGGAEVGRGNGLVELADRVAARDGRLTLASPPGGGTLLSVELPLGDPA